MDGHANVSIRAFRPSDAGALRALICQTIETSYSGAYPPRAVAFFKDFHGEAQILQRGHDGTVLVVEMDGDLIATGSLVEGEILAVFVHPKRQQSGLGKALMRRLEDTARDAGTTEATLSVSLPSKSFYESLGYELIEARSRELGGGQRLDFWKARKRLAADD